MGAGAALASMMKVVRRRMMMVMGSHDETTGRGSTDVCSKHMPLQSCNGVSRTRRNMERIQRAERSELDVSLRVCFSFPNACGPRASPRIDKFARRVRKRDKLPMVG